MVAFNAITIEIIKYVVSFYNSLFFFLLSLLPTSHLFIVQRVNGNLLVNHSFLYHLAEVINFRKLL